MSLHEPPYATPVAALAAPLGHPPLANSLFPGDCVAVVPDPFVASKTELLATIIREIVSHHIEPANVVLLMTESEEKKYGAIVRAAIEPETQVVVHHPGMRQELARIAVNATGQALALNRHLVDADLVLLVASEARDAAAIPGIAMFPRFADIETIRRFETPGRLDARHRKQEIAAAVHELGLLLTLQCNPSPLGYTFIASAVR